MFYLIAFQGHDKENYHRNKYSWILSAALGQRYGAYLAGRWLGKTKLFERISPKKPGKESAVVFSLTAVGSVYHRDVLYQPGSIELVHHSA